MVRPILFKEMYEKLGCPLVASGVTPAPGTTFLHRNRIKYVSQDQEALCVTFMCLWSDNYSQMFEVG